MSKKKYQRFFKRYIEEFQISIQNNRIETALFDEEIIAAKQAELAKLKRDFTNLEEIIRKYSQANLTDYPSLKRDLSEQMDNVNSAMEKNFSTFERVLVSGVVLGFLMIVAIVSLKEFGIITSRAIYTAITMLSFVVIISSAIKSLKYVNIDSFNLEIARINRLNAEINKILECQKTIELISSYQERCKFISKFTQILNPEDLKNEIPITLRSNPTVPLSSSKYLLKKSEKLNEKEWPKDREKPQNFKENKQEEKEEKQEDPEIKLPMDEEQDYTPEFK